MLEEHINHRVLPNFLLESGKIIRTQAKKFNNSFPNSDNQNATLKNKAFAGVYGRVFPVLGASNLGANQCAYMGFITN